MGTRFLTAGAAAVCGFALLVLSGYEPFSRVLVISGVVVVLGSAVLGIYALAAGRQRLFAPGRRSGVGLFRNGVIAIVIAVAGSAPMVMSGYRADHVSGLAFGGVFLAGSALYWAFAAFRYRRARRAEDARTPEEVREAEARPAPWLGPGAYTRFWVMRVVGLGLGAALMLTTFTSSREPWVLVAIAAVLAVAAAVLALAAAAAGRDAYGPWWRTLGRRRADRGGGRSGRRDRGPG